MKVRNRQGKNNILRNSHIDLNESNESIIIDNTINDTIEKENIYGKIEKKKIRERLHCIICWYYLRLVYILLTDLLLTDLLLVDLLLVDPFLCFLVGFFFHDLILEKLAPKFSKLKDSFNKNNTLYFIAFRFVGGGFVCIVLSEN